MTFGPFDMPEADLDEGKARAAEWPSDLREPRLARIDAGSGFDNVSVAEAALA
jgi:hypothetical protein